MQTISKLPYDIHGQKLDNLANRFIKLMMQDVKAMDPLNIRSECIRVYLEMTRAFISKITDGESREKHQKIVLSLYNEAAERARNDIQALTSEYTGPYSTTIPRNVFFKSCREVIKENDDPLTINASLIAILTTLLCHTPYMWHTEANMIRNLADELFLQRTSTNNDGTSQPLRFSQLQPKH